MKTIKVYDLVGLFVRQVQYSWRTSEYLNEVMKKQGIDFKCSGAGSYLQDRNYALLIDTVFRMQMFATRSQLYTLRERTRGNHPML